MLIFSYRLLVMKNTTVSMYWLIGTVCFLLPFIFNVFRFRSLAQIAICYIPVMYLWYVLQNNVVIEKKAEVTMMDGLTMYLLATGTFPYLIMDRQRVPILLINILPALISVLFIERIMNVFGIELPKDMTNDDSQLMPVRSLVSYVVISSGCLVLQYIVYRNDQFNHKLIVDLKNIMEELKSKNVELLNQKKQLAEINLNLERIIEEKTNNIGKQNEQLINYAFKNAHHVRGPIARILGLFQISDLEKEIDYDWYFQRVKLEAESVDKILQGISEELNAITHHEIKKD